MAGPTAKGTPSCGVANHITQRDSLVGNGAAGAVLQSANWRKTKDSFALEVPVEVLAKLDLCAEESLRGMAQHPFEGWNVRNMCGCHITHWLKLISAPLSGGASIRG